MNAENSNEILSYDIFFIFINKIKNMSDVEIICQENGFFIYGKIQKIIELFLQVSEFIKNGSRNHPYIMTKKYIEDIMTNYEFNYNKVDFKLFLTPDEQLKTLLSFSYFEEVNDGIFRVFYNNSEMSNYLSIKKNLDK